MRTLLVGDLHLTALPRDAYRWRIFDTIAQLVNEHGADDVVLLGDLTDEKDKHTAELVNRVVAEVAQLSTLAVVHVVRGNHDGIDPAWPYFNFLNAVSGKHRIYFYAAPQVMFGSRSVFILPHSRDPLRDWGRIDFKGTSVVFAHVTVEGADSESGIALRSEVSEQWFRERKVSVYAGDVHVPQRRGCVLYVGAPYPIRFGDSFVPRVVLLGNDFEETSIDLPHLVTRSMMDVQDVSDLHLENGEQVKVRLHLPDDMLGQWLVKRKQIIEQCRAAGADLVSIELVREEGVRSITAPSRRATSNVFAAFKEYVKQHEISDERAGVGKKLLRLVKEETS